MANQQKGQFKDRKDSNVDATQGDFYGQSLVAKSPAPKYVSDAVAVGKSYHVLDPIHDKANKALEGRKLPKQGIQDQV